MLIAETHIVGAVVWDGIGSAIVGGVIGGLVAVAVVRAQARGDERRTLAQIAADERHSREQIAADERRSDRAAITEVASRMQRHSIGFAFALGRLIQDEAAATRDAEDRLLDLWVGCADARALRPTDDELRVWADEFQEQLVERSNSWWQNPPTWDEARPFIEWVNTCATVVARHLDTDTVLGPLPPARWETISHSHEEGEGS